MPKDLEVLPAPTPEQAGLTGASGRHVAGFDREADRRSRRSGYRVWLDEQHRETFDGETPPDDVPDILIRLRIAYAIARAALELNGETIGPKFQQNFDAAMAMNEELFTRELRSMVESAISRTAHQTKENVMTQAVRAKTIKKPKGSAKPAGRGSRSTDANGRKITDVMYEIFSRKVVPTDVEIIKELAKDFPRHHITTTRKASLAWWINRFIEGTFRGYEDKGPQKFRQPDVGPAVNPNGRPRVPRTADELKAARKTRESGKPDKKAPKAAPDKKAPKAAPDKKAPKAASDKKAPKAASGKKAPKADAQRESANVDA